MKKYRIKLEKITDITKFVRVMENMPFEARLKHNAYCCDAKSLMGIYGMNLSVPLDLEIDVPENVSAEDEVKFNSLIQDISYLFVDKSELAKRYERVIDDISVIIEAGKKNPDDNAEFEEFIKELRDLIS